LEGNFQRTREDIEMTEYVIGMDGGGTKTVVKIADMDGRELAAFTGGAMNYNGQDGKSIDKNIHTILQIISNQGFTKERCHAICIGTAGISNPAVRKHISEIVTQCGFRCPISIVGDHEIALAGALGRSEGIIVIAGTGSICLGKDSKGHQYRSGGYGHLIDDEGSGYAIARDMLSAVVQALDGRSVPTLLTDLVFHYLNIQTVEELVAYIYHPNRNKKEIAELSFLIEKAYQSGDAASVAIIEKCVRELVKLVTPVIKSMYQEGNLAVSGSVLLKNEEIYHLFSEKLHEEFPGIVVIKAKEEAAFGAVVLALEQ